MYSLSPKSHLYWCFPPTSLELSPRALWGAVCSLLSSFCPSYNWTGNPRVVHLFSVDRGQGMTQWMQVPLECPLPEGSVACIADASTARLRSCLHSLFFPVWFGRSAELSVGPEPPRTNLSLLEGPSSLVKSPLSRYIGLIKGKYFNNMENGRFYSVVGGKKKHVLKQHVIWSCFVKQNQPNTTKTQIHIQRKKVWSICIKFYFWLIGWKWF